ncbi:MAG TPA: flagellar hook-length control protein FliK [Solirubrobacteraceae bacterium]|nr:flagellar hook-length control protein FliK [Solirubrobacteraceae bacterium]
MRGERGAISGQNSDAHAGASLRPPAAAPTASRTAQGGEGRQGSAAAHTAATNIATAGGASIHAEIEPGNGGDVAATVQASQPQPGGDGPLLGANVGLAEIIERVNATVQLAARQGLSQARIALEPEELGQVRIHLTQTRDGLIARVAADSPEAARALLSGRGELAHSLRSLGSSLLSLDISSSGEQGVHGQARGSAAGTPENSGSRRAPQDGATDTDHTQPQEGARPDSPKGALVDVLA